MAIKSITTSQIQSLKWAREMAADWKGNHNPESHDEFDQWIADVDAAIAQVSIDRANYRLMQRHKESRERRLNCEA